MGAGSLWNAKARQFLDPRGLLPVSSPSSACIATDMADLADPRR